MKLTARQFCTPDELARMSVCGTRPGGPYGQVLGCHPARLHWVFLALNFIKDRNWPVGRPVRRGDMVEQWYRLGGGWSGHARRVGRNLIWK